MATIVEAYWIELALMETVYGILFAAFLVQLVQERQQRHYQALHVTAPTAVAQAGGKVPYALKRLGLSASVTQVLLFVDANGVNGIWPAELRFTLNNLTGAALLAASVLVAVFSFEPIYNAARMRHAGQSDFVRNLLRGAYTLIAATVVVAIATGLMNSSGNGKPEAFFALWCVLFLALTVGGWIYSLQRLQELLDAAPVPVSAPRDDLPEKFNRFRKFSQ